MSITELNEGNFDAFLDQELALIAFGAPWCEPCKNMDTVLATLASSVQDAAIGHVNIDTNPSLADDFNIRSIPWILVVRRRVILSAQSGSQSIAALEDLLAQARAVPDTQLQAAKDETS